jgi:ABC-2 type transport system permease protein
MTVAEVPSVRILPAVWKLLSLRVRISVNEFRHAKTGAKIGMLIAALMILAVAGFIFWLSWLLLGFLRSPDLAQYVDINLPQVLQAFPVLILTGMFIGILLTSFGVLLQALYLSGDMDFLLSFPLPIRAVFITKLLQAVLPNLGLISLFGLPVLFGLGVSGGYHFLYYPLLVLILIALALVAAGISSLLVMLVARVFPARRAAEIIAFLGATFAIICSQLGNFSQSFTDNADFSGEQASGLVDLLMKVNTVWLPTNWAGRGLVDIGEGRWLSGTLFVALTLGLSSLGFWLALITAERWYYSGWAGMQVVARKKQPVRTAQTTTSDQVVTPLWVKRLIPAPVRAIIHKDFLVMRRDLRNMSQLISPLIFGVVYALMLLRGGGEPPPGRGEAPSWFMDSFSTVLTYGSVGISLFVGWTLSSRLAGIGFSQEGKNYWILKASPVRVSHLLAAKFLVSYLPTLALGLLFLIVISILQGFSLVGFAYSLAIVALSLAGMNGILVGSGAAGANFNWDNPQKMNAGSMGCLGQVLAMIYLPASFVLFIGPLFVASAFQMSPVYGYLIGLIMGIAANLVCTLLPLMLVKKRVERLGE